jgi:transcription initiation factor TFIID subunit 2
LARNCIVYSTHLLHDESIIDQTYETTRYQCLAVVSQWFGNYIEAKTWSDSWITMGFAGYLSLLCYKSIFGGNEFRYYMFRVCNTIITAIGDWRLTIDD